MGISVSSLNTAQRVGDALSHGLNNVNAVKETFSEEGDGIKATSNALNSINDFMGVMGTATKGTNAAATVASMTATFNSMITDWNNDENPHIKVSDIVNMASDIAALGSAGIPHPAAKLALGGLSLLLAGLATVIGDDPSIPVDDIKGAINSAMDTFDKVKDGFNDAIGTIGNTIDEAMKPNNNLPLYLDHHSTIPDNLSNPFGNVIQYDPLALDLDNDGKISIISQQESSVYFDHDADNIAFGSSWIAPNDGLLVFDRNANGTIDNGNELFGNFTLNSNNEFANNGYEALAQLDSDKNGIIDSNDTEFENLKVWIDENSDGTTQENELKTLSELEIKSLNLTATEVNQNLGNGNTLTLQGSYTKFDGTTAMSGDIDFSVNTIHREFKDELNLTAEQLARANVKGSGYLRDLKEACALSENLANLIDEYANLKDKQSQVNLLDNIILEWAKTNPNYNEIVEISKTNVSNNPNARDIYLTPTQYRDFLNNNFANFMGES